MQELGGKPLPRRSPIRQKYSGCGHAQSRQAMYWYCDHESSAPARWSRQRLDGHDAGQTPAQSCRACWEDRSARQRVQIQDWVLSQQV